MTDPKQFLICQSKADATRIDVMQDENLTVRLFRTVANTKNFEVMTRVKTPMKDNPWH